MEENALSRSLSALLEVTSSKFCYSKEFYLNFWILSESNLSHLAQHAPLLIKCLSHAVNDLRSCHAAGLKSSHLFGFNVVQTASLICQVCSKIISIPINSESLIYEHPPEKNTHKKKQRGFRSPHPQWHDKPWWRSPQKQQISSECIKVSHGMSQKGKKHWSWVQNTWLVIFILLDRVWSP